MHYYKTYLSVFGIGYLPFAPGTFGSLIALPVSWLLTSNIGVYASASLTIILLLFGIIFTNKLIDKNKDPSWIVMDEFCGQLLVLLFMEISIISYIFSFILFRIFDILKPWPITLIDKSMKNSFGIFFDDIMAAIFSIITINLFMFIMWGKFGSFFWRYYLIILIYN